MRLDKFLKVSRLIKRRTLAKEACEGGRIKLNGRAAKAGAEVQTGDELTLHVGGRRLTVQILELREAVPAVEASHLYRVLEELREDAY